jgi:hypothetical protein
LQEVSLFLINSKGWDNGEQTALRYNLGAITVKNPVGTWVKGQPLDGHYNWRTSKDAGNEMKRLRGLWWISTNGATTS